MAAIRISAWAPNSSSVRGQGQVLDNGAVCCRGGQCLPAPAWGCGAQASAVATLNRPRQSHLAACCSKRSSFFGPAPGAGASPPLGIPTLCVCCPKQAGQPRLGPEVLRGGALKTRQAAWPPASRMQLSCCHSSSAAASPASFGRRMPVAAEGGGTAVACRALAAGVAPGGLRPAPPPRPPLPLPQQPPLVLAQLLQSSPRAAPPRPPPPPPLPPLTSSSQPRPMPPPVPTLLQSPSLVGGSIWGLLNCMAPPAVGRGLFKGLFGKALRG